MELISNKINLPLHYLKESIGHKVKVSCKENVVLEGILHVN